MKENYQIYLPYQFHRRPQSLDRDPQLPHKKMKTLYLWNMSKSRRLTSTDFDFFPDDDVDEEILIKKNPCDTHGLARLKATRSF